MATLTESGKRLRGRLLKAAAEMVGVEAVEAWMEEHCGKVNALCHWLDTEGATPEVEMKVMARFFAETGLGASYVARLKEALRS